MKQKVFNLLNKNVSEIEISDAIFGIKVFPDLIHQYIRYQNSKSRQGSHKTKSRSEISGRAKKPFAQKGTGNARQGSSKPPHFRGGATSMGPQNRDHSFSLNKKEKMLALKCALSNKINNDEIIIIDSYEVDDHKTKNLYNNLKNFEFRSALFIHNDNEKNENFKRASSNIPRLAMLSDKGLNVKDLMTFEKIFIETKSLDQITKRFV
jgi:large subunit ribosomal protein L4